MFWKHVKQKKIHEISVLGLKCADIAYKTNCKVVVDCGSGLGHLARLLAYKYRLYVICIEAQEKLCERASELDSEFEKHVTKHAPSLLEGCHRPVHIHYKLQSNTNINELFKVIASCSSIPVSEIGLVGLHPCGDLAPVLLRLFVTSDRVAFSCTVGCCYMKLTEIGHPLSEHLERSALTYAARELACHAIEQLKIRLSGEGLVHLRTHAWRATLEKLIVDRWPNMKRLGMTL